MPRMTLDEAIAHSLKIARYGKAEEVGIGCIEEHAQLYRWLVELKERRRAGYHPPCPSCYHRDNCTVTSSGRQAEDWRCTMYEYDAP